MFQVIDIQALFNCCPKTTVNIVVAEQTVAASCASSVISSVATSVAGPCLLVVWRLVLEMGLLLILVLK